MLLLLCEVMKYSSSKRFSTLTWARRCSLRVKNTPASKRVKLGRVTVLSIEANISSW
jgi:hypothetical protein